MKCVDCEEHMNLEQAEYDSDYVLLTYYCFLCKGTFLVSREVVNKFDMERVE
jgi:hypothetical protein